MIIDPAIELSLKNHPIVKKTKEVTLTILRQLQDGVREAHPLFQGRMDALAKACGHKCIEVALLTLVEVKSPYDDPFPLIYHPRSLLPLTDEEVKEVINEELRLDNLTWYTLGVRGLPAGLYLILVTVRNKDPVLTDTAVEIFQPDPYRGTDWTITLGVEIEPTDLLVIVPLGVMYFSEVQPETMMIPISVSSWAEVVSVSVVSL